MIPTYADMRDISVMFLLAGPMIFAAGYIMELIYGFQYSLLMGFGIMIAFLCCAIVVSWNYWRIRQKEEQG
jgi:hypothetical protein